MATVAPVTNPARNAMTTIRITVSFFILFSFFSWNFISSNSINQFTKLDFDRERLGEKSEGEEEI
jgi:hypothetical protein